MSGAGTTRRPKGYVKPFRASYGKKPMKKSYKRASGRAPMDYQSTAATPKSYVARYARGLIGNKGIEIKALDVPITDYALSSVSDNTQVKLLNGVQEGAAFFNRIGRKITMKSLQMTASFVKTTTANAQDDLIRFAIVYDRQPSAAAAAPAYDDIFKVYDAVGNATTSVLAGVNLDNRERFIILRDFISVLPAVLTPASAPPSGPTQMMVMDNSRNAINDYIKLKGLDTHFNGTANPITQANITTGALYLVTKGLFGAGGQAWYLRANFRLRYDD